MDGRWFALAGCLAVGGCDAGAEDEAPEKGSSSGASTGGCASGGCDESTTDVPEPDATTGAAQSSSSGTDAGSTSSVGASTSTGDAETGEETGGEDACGPAPAGPIEGCTPWRVELPSGFQTNAIIPFPGDLYVVSGTLDGVGYVEAFDTQGASQWSFEHATNVIEAVPVGDDRLFGVVSGTPGFVFLLEIETQTVLWEQRLDEDFVVFPDLGPNTYFIAQQPKHVAASADGQLAVVMRGTGWNDYHVTMGLDPLTGEQTWLHVDYADWYFSTELRFNDVGGWFVHLAAYGVGGGAGFRTRRFDPETGAELESPLGPSGGGTPGVSPGTFTLRSDGALVVTRTQSTPIADTARVMTVLPDGSSAGTVEFTTAFRPTNPSSTVDASDRVYFLVGRDESQAIYRFDVDASVTEVQRRCDQDELHELAAVGEHAIAALGRTDAGDFVEQFCFE